MIRILITAALLGCLTGCLSVQTVTLEVDLINKSFASRYDGIGTSARNEAEAIQDYSELKAMIHGDTFVREQAERGVTVNQRSLELKDDRLCAEYSGRFEKPGDILDNYYEGKEGSLVLVRKDNDADSVITNGTVEVSDNFFIITWKPEQKILQLTMHAKTPDDIPSILSDKMPTAVSPASLVELYTKDPNK